MAVLNNRVVSEGDSIDGFSLISINMEDVIVKEGQKLWKVNLGQ
jgi:hypothetical protein